jgi:hypothetical protein
MIILIPTCNRAEMAWNLCNQLKKAEKIVLCVNNCSVFPYYNYKWNDNIHIQYFEFKGDPKMCHNKTFRRMFDIPDNDILVLEDDVVLCDDFLYKFNHFVREIEWKQYELINGYPTIDSPKPFAFTPIYIPEKKCNYTPVFSETIFDDIGYKVFTQKYVDGIFYMSKGLHHEVKDWFIHEEVPVLKSSSGIGRFLSKRMYGAKFNMYGISPSLIGHGDHESIQFGEARKRVPLIAKI